MIQFGLANFLHSYKEKIREGEIKMAARILILFFSLLFTAPVFAQDASDFDKELYQVTLNVCKGANVGAKTPLQKAMAWANRTGHTNYYPNSHPDTFVSIPNFAGLRDGFINLFTRFQLRTNTDMINMTKNESYQAALNDCFMNLNLPPERIAEVKNNFMKEHLDQLTVGQVLAVTGTLVAAKGLNSAAMGTAAKGLTLVGTATTTRLATKAPATAAYLAEATKSTFPGGFVRTATGAAQIFAIAHLGKFLYDTYSVGKHFKKTAIAVKDQKSQEEIADTFISDFSDAIGANMKDRRQELIGGVEDMITRLDTRITEVKAVNEGSETKLATLDPNDAEALRLHKVLAENRVYLEKLITVQAEQQIILASLINENPPIIADVMEQPEQAYQ